MFVNHQEQSHRSFHSRQRRRRQQQRGYLRIPTTTALGNRNIQWNPDIGFSIPIPRSRIRRPWNFSSQRFIIYYPFKSKRRRFTGNP
ncbi:hypothetical protein Vadar_009407 [Vaccinium darrowii]|uniref:Uncharacterized protein n=1 Tax=Vaccinium darrowii TaxID=229202 RepID=A0ACB7YKZ2_9ERIC|nr:hypothetical protein Vadar_009407 [Vaccinium darrowii]